MARLAKPILFVGSLLPALLLVYGTLTGTLGVNPAETLQNETGEWAMRFLLASLAVTPVRRLTGWNVVIQYRRMLGLFAFFYATLHLLTYWSLDLGFAIGDFAADVLRRPFIALGLAAFLLMLPLALTSTRGWIRRLGRTWARLHRLAYVAAIAAMIHFVLKVKVFTGDPVAYAAVLTALLAFRIVWAVRARRAKAAVRPAS